jgi:hypothetical protein
VKEMYTNSNPDLKKGCFTLENVFSYFMAIGSGLAAGLVIILIPSYMIFKKLQRGGKKDARKTY